MSKQLFLWLTLITSFIATSEGVYAYPMHVNTQDGEVVVLDVDPKQTIECVQDEITYLFNGNEQGVLIELPSKKGSKRVDLSVNRHGQYLGHPREYYKAVTASERADVYFIVSFLAERSIFAITAHRKEIEAAGDRIDHLHPLRFVAEIVKSPKMRHNAKIIRGRCALIADPFFDGIKDSLMTESLLLNVTDEMIMDFAVDANLNRDEIKGPLQQKRYDEFIDIIIMSEQNEDADRFDFSTQ